jgi:type II restriction/modification system DNA methylase subunit YeeA
LGLTRNENRVSAEADFVCYWFAKAFEAMRAGRVSRVGLVATNSIRGGANRRVLDPIVAEGKIFEAWSDEPWIIDGAAVRVSLVCFGEDEKKHLDGHAAQCINADLTELVGDITQASPRTAASLSWATPRAGPLTCREKWRALG